MLVRELRRHNKCYTKKTVNCKISHKKNDFNLGCNMQPKQLYFVNFRATINMRITNNNNVEAKAILGAGTTACPRGS